MSMNNTSEQSPNERDDSNPSMVQVVLLLANSWKTIVFTTLGVIAVTALYIYTAPRLYSVSSSVTALQSEPDINVILPKALTELTEPKHLFTLNSRQLQVMLSDTLSSQDVVARFFKNNTSEAQNRNYIQDIDVSVLSEGANVIFYTRTEGVEAKLLRDYIAFALNEFHKKIGQQRDVAFQQHLESLEAEQEALSYLHKLQLQASIEQLKRARALANELGVNEPQADIAGFSGSTEQIASQEVGEVIALYGLGDRHLEQLVNSLSTPSYETDELLTLKAQEAFVKRHQELEVTKLFTLGQLDSRQTQVRPRTFLLILMSIILGLLLGMVVAIVRNRSKLQ